MHPARVHPARVPRRCFCALAKVAWFLEHVHIALFVAEVPCASASMRTAGSFAPPRIPI